MTQIICQAHGLPFVNGSGCAKCQTLAAPVPRFEHSSPGVIALALLPNLDGFPFIGIKPDGTECHCQVIRDKETGLHYVGGEAIYPELGAWKRKP